MTPNTPHREPTSWLELLTPETGSRAPGREAGVDADADEPCSILEARVPARGVE